MHRVREDCQIPDPVERRELFTLDMVYNYYFPTKGKFLEVGAFDGETLSNTCLLADDGWKGIYIEAVPDYYKLCKKRHKFNDVVVLNKAISDSKKSVFIDQQGEFSKITENETSFLVSTATLDSVLDDLKINYSFDLMVVDVEEHELEVFKGFSISKYSPSIVIVEMHEEHSLGWENVGLKNQLTSELLESNNYEKVWFDYINTIFIHKSLLKSRGNFFNGITK